MRLGARIARARLLHFAVLGTLGFVAAPRERPPAASPDRHIEVTPQVLATIRARERLEAGRPVPAVAVERWIEEEILFREGLRAELHWNPAALARAEQMAAFLGEDAHDEATDAPGWGDPVLRAQVVGKMRILLQREADGLAPSPAELEQHLAANAEEYALPMGVRFSHVFLDASLRGDRLAQDAARTLAALAGSRAKARARAVESGDPFPIGDSEMFRSVPEIERTFGPELARAVSSEPIGVWVGPFRSPYGMHLVRIHERTPARMPALGEVRDAVELQWREARGDEIAARKLEALRARYEVAISAPGLRPAERAQ